MFRIRKITNPFLEGNKQILEKIKLIINEQFPALRDRFIEDISDHMVNPIKTQSYTFLIVADDFRGNIRGFAIMMYMSDLKICYLDLLSVNPKRPTSGVGGSIYEKLREEASSLGSIGIFFEALPDDPALCRDLTVIRQNEKRLAFYERYGAYPIVNTRYETPVKQEDDCPPYMVYDDLGSGRPLSAVELKRIYRGILERKYHELCPPEYINMVVESVVDNPVSLRSPIYYRNDHIDKTVLTKTTDFKIQLFVNARHEIHHVREVGYVESPVRVKSILTELSRLNIMFENKVSEYPEKYILETHDKGYLNYFKTVCRNMEPGKSVYPYVFPVRNVAKPPKVLSVRAGYYCIDTFTPLNRNAYLAALWGVNCSLSAADSILSGNKAAYVLTRPPGHHAERSVFGGFCYFNNAAIAANFLSKYGSVAILDVDYHHGNGQQQIFYERADVLTISIHGDPSFAYPYFSGFRDETGKNKGLGYNHNLPLKEEISGEEYRKTLKKALHFIERFNPDFLIVALGLDTAKGDPTGTWILSAKDFYLNGKMIAELNIPSLFIQEGGYRNRFLGINARSFFKGVHDQFNVNI
ncbi:MAG: histone deacetylase family protein [Bacteroidales bacterium]|jgi:acetoin utilization deacetylase AcuC-like enzyme|nr:histone deacetylase family protein [Bacteroidales bacterium]